MTFEEFFNKYNGKFVDRYDLSAKYQCVDLFLAYIDEVLGLGSMIPLGIASAYQIWKLNKLEPYFDFIANTPDAIPQKGDIVIWGSSYGPAGHVAIATGEGNLNWFKAFSQNDPLGTNSHVVVYSYNHVLGWLRRKGITNSETNDMQDVLNKYFNQVVNVDYVIQFLNDRKEEIGRLNKAISEKDELISTMTADLLKFQDQVKTASEQAEKYKLEAQKKEELRQKWYSLYEEANKNYEVCKADRTYLQKQVTELQKEYPELTLGDHVKGILAIIFRLK